MNLFYLHPNPIQNPKQHIDKHVIKLIVEGAQILSAAHHLTGGTAPYRLTHKWHPIIRWVCESEENYQWTLTYTKGLCSEYNYRYGKVHKTEQHVLWLDNNRPNLPDIGLTEHPQCMPQEHRVLGDPVAAYRNYYRTKNFDKSGKNMFVWTGRERPDWL